MERCIEKILGVYRNHLGIDKGQEAVLTYALHIMVSTILGYFLVLVVAQLLGNFSYVLMILLNVSILRASSGGAHCESMWNCAIFSIILCNLLGFLVKVMVPTKEITLSIVMIVFLFGLWSLSKYAPADTPQKPITSIEKRKKLKRRSLIILLVWCFLNLGYYILFKNGHSMMIASSLGVFSQCFSITKVGYKIWLQSDVLLNKILGK